MRRLLLFLCLVHLAVCQRIKHSYLMKRHLSVREIPSEFSIYNQATNAREYRINSHITLKPEGSDILAYPSKRIVGKLKIKREGQRRYVSFEVLNNKTQEWMTGEFIQYYIGWIKDSIDIEWDGPTINCEIANTRLNGTFRDDRGNILAQFQRQRATLFTLTKYVVQIYSEDIPNPFYLLFVANYDTIRPFV